jgi:hypothetical protein
VENSGSSFGFAVEKAGTYFLVGEVGHEFMIRI